MPGRHGAAEAVRRWRPGRPVDLLATLGPLRRGRHDPAFAVAVDGAVWLAGTSPTGPVTQRLAVAGDEVVLHAWGPGSAWALDRLPILLGADDDPAGFDPTGLPPALVGAWSRLGRGWRVPRTGRVLDALVPAVLEQKVTGREARRAWRGLLVRYGEPAPGQRPGVDAPAGPRPPAVLHVPPGPDALRSVPSWEWHRLGVEGVRSATVLRAAAVAGRLEECIDLPAEQARRRLQSIPGIGPWTAAEVAQRALGDADAVSFGDYHLGRQVVYAFTGATDGDDEGMRSLLEPWLGHRYRVQRLVEVAGIAPPRRGPRLPARDYRSM